MNLYCFVIDVLDNETDEEIITRKVHNVEAENMFQAETMLNHLYDKFEPYKSIVDIIKTERIATEIIHNKH